MKPEEARKLYAEFLEKQELTKEEMAMWKQIQIDAHADIAPIQHWVSHSGGPPAAGWTEEKWRRFHALLPKMQTQVEVQLYRGTKLPWLEGTIKKFKSAADIRAAIKKFDESFAAKKSRTLRRMTSFTTCKKIANRFASQSKGYKTDEGYTMGNGFIHVIKPSAGLKGIDVAAEVAKVHKPIHPDSDELAACKIEKEFLILPGATFMPFSKKGRVYTWTYVPRTRRRRGPLS